jgi:hypothetical protein
MLLKARSKVLLYALVFTEGYVVLALEVLAIRLLLPFVGSGTEVIAIVISGVLLPLAAGYYLGTRRFAQDVATQQRNRARNYPTIRRVLLRNVLSALGILVFGFSYVFLEFYFSLLTTLSVPRLWQTTLYVTTFLAYPVFLLAQTVPLISDYFSSTRLSDHTGRMLFFSTAGSFCGAIFSTMVLMNTVGVHYTVIVTLGLLSALAILLVRTWKSYDLVLAASLFVVVAIVNSDTALAPFHMVANNGYNTVAVKDSGYKDERLLQINRSFSSKYTTTDANRFPYIAYIEDHFIRTMPADAPRDILVIGAGGFTLGLKDTRNRYTFVDIDPSLKQVAETHFLKAPLSTNKTFIPLSARAFLRDTHKKYDLIFVDVFSNMVSIPMECITVEFLSALRARVAKGGVVAVNVIGNANFSDRFTARYANSFAKVFPVHSVQTIGDIQPWEAKPPLANLIFTYYNTIAARDTGTYTDNLNTYSLDRH